MPDGIATIEKIFDTFAVQRQAVVPFFDEEGRQRMVPHPDNVRNHEQVIRKYVQSVLKNGIIECMRGDPIAVNSPSGQGPIKMLSWGSLTRAFYRAHEQEPQHDNVQRTLQRGLRQVTILHARTPKDVTDFVRDFCNLWHHGANKNFVDCMSEAKKIEQGWQAHALTSGITARSCGRGDDSYRSRQWRWIDEHHSKVFETMEAYELGKVAYNFMVDEKFWEPFGKFVGNVGLLDDPRVSNKTVMKVLHSFTKVIDHIHAAHDPQVFQVLLIEATRFMIPCAGSLDCEGLTGIQMTSGREVDWLSIRTAVH